jgi:hypothetical protein
MNNSITNDFYIYSIKNSLSKPLCKEIIERFDKEDKRHAGITFGGENKDIKDTTDFHLSRNPANWSDVDKVLTNELSKGLDEYIRYLNKDIMIYSYFGINDLGFQIQKYEKGVGKYIFHNDSQVYIKQGWVRDFTYIWYLNTIEEGGETSFFNKGLVKPTAGTLIFFPATWDYPHSGLMPVSDDKYIITGWVSHTINRTNDIREDWFNSP